MISDPSTTAWLNRLSLGSKIDQPQKSAHLGRNRLPIPETLHGPRLSLAQGQQRCAPSNLCALFRKLGAMTQGVWNFAHKLKKRRCDEGCTRVLLLHILSYNTLSERELLTQVRLAISGF